MTKFISDVITAIERCEHVRAILFDLTKAFDCVPHDLLIQKLELLGIRELALKLIKSYLLDREQCVVVNNKHSDYLKNKFGVPQGSVIGPLLFCIFINDIVNDSNLAKYILYADDTTFYLTDKCIEMLYNKLNLIQKEIESWFIKNKLTINKNKTDFINFHPGFANHDETKSTVKLLGIVLDSQLNWEGHILERNYQQHYSSYDP